jgi:ATP-binding protein involved in chromosome partitioning
MTNNQMPAEREVIKLNIDMRCDFKCESCEKFFDCEKEEKWKIYDRRRMGKAKERMAGIRHKIAVAGGKGGTGKSTFTANLAMAFAMMGYKVSILDQDLDGATIPKMYGVMDKKLKVSKEGIIPVEGLNGVQIVSMGLLQGSEEVITMFHEMRRGTTEEFLSHVVYGERDYLFVDLPPGTSSDAVNLLQYIPDLDGVIIVTVPPRVSQLAARRAALLVLKAKRRLLGIIENMSGMYCPKCGGYYEVMLSGGGEKLAEEVGAPFLGRVPLTKEVSSASDEGIPFVYKYPDNPASLKVMEIARKIQTAVENVSDKKEE